MQKTFNEIKKLCKATKKLCTLKVQSHEVALERQGCGIDVLQAWQENGKIYKCTDFLPWDTKFLNTLLCIFIGILWGKVMKYFDLSPYWYILLIVAVFIWAIDIIPLLYFVIKFRKEKPWKTTKSRNN